MADFVTKDEDRSSEAALGVCVGEGGCSAQFLVLMSLDRRRVRV